MFSFWLRIRKNSVFLFLVLGGIVIYSFQNCARIQYNDSADALDSNQSLTVDVGTDDETEVDTDGDDLSDNFEISIGTDPNNPDTDGGDVNDGIEVESGTDPLNPKDDYKLSDVDTDGDGLTDREEFVIGTNPYKKDSDFGGAIDGIEVDLGLNPLNPKDDYKAKHAHH